MSLSPGVWRPSPTTFLSDTCYYIIVGRNPVCVWVEHESPSEILPPSRIFSSVR